MLKPPRLYWNLMRTRVRAIYAGLTEPVDVIALSNSTDPHIDMSFFYATGVPTGLFEGCAAFLYPSGRAHFLTSALEEESARKSPVPAKVFRNRDHRQKLIAAGLAAAKKVGINAGEITHRAFSELKKLAPRGAKFIDVSAAIVQARLVKDAQEIALLRRSCQIASEAFEEILPHLRPGVREYEVAADLVHTMQRKGATGASFSTIVGSGPNSAEPHYTAGERRLRRGDFVVLDFGALYRRYCSDITRTVVIGRASRKQKEIYETVARAQAAAQERMREGVVGKDVDAAARDVIDASPYKGRFIHGLGHSIGLAVHDGGGLNTVSTLTLKRNMVFSNEPGIYVPRFGGVRIEDDVLITATKPRFLTTATRELLEL